MPLANAFLRPDQLNEPEPKYPITLCHCARCGMVQLRHVVPAGLLFAHDYPFFTSSSKAMSKHFIDLMDEYTLPLKPLSLVVEIGANDCTAFRGMQRTDLIKYAVDPADNMPWAGAHVARQIKECFTQGNAQFILGEAKQKASLIVACNVLGHIDDLDDLMRGVNDLLAEDGVFVVEVPYLHDLLDRVEWSTVYHEHASYFCVQSLDALMARYGMSINMVTPQNVHCGSIRCVIRRGKTRSIYGDKPTAGELNQFARDAECTRLDLLAELHALKAAGKRTIGYCASAKGTVILNYCNIGPDLVPLVVDSTPAKIGKLMPGTHQPIIDSSELQAMKPDAILLLAPNHAEEIKAKEAWFTGEWLNPYGDA